MGFLSSLAASFVDGLHNGQQSISTPSKSSVQQPQAPAQQSKPFFLPAYSDSDFENRLLRARTEPLSILRQRFVRDQCVSVDVHNAQTGGTYHVTPESCDCEDFKKHGQPCKHMIFFALKSGDFLRYEKPVPFSSPKSSGGVFIPSYGRYYSGRPTGIGYKNLYPYRVVGRVYGTSEKTGRPTNRKKEVVVDAHSPDDAQAAAASIGVSPPYAEVSILDVSPSYSQLSYLHAVGIPFPFFVTADDVCALLTRYQRELDDLCPRGLFNMATARRVGVSFFAAPQCVIDDIWYCAPSDDLPSLFCYAVYCRENNFEIGCAPLPWYDDVFTSFSPDNKQVLQYITKGFCPKFPIKSMSTRSLSYGAAAFHIRKRKPWIIP